MEYAAAVAAAAVMAEPECVICAHSERDAIEAHRRSGATYMLIARLLKAIGALGNEISVRAAARRVAIHFREHDEGCDWR
ncbi:MAG: hypothetical protein WEE66_13665 [Actinomycetota bacterium]